MKELNPQATRDKEGRGPAWLVWAGGVVLLLILLFAVFSMGVYMGERDMTRAVLPPWPEPRPSATPAPTLPPLPTAPVLTSKLEMQQCRLATTRARQGLSDTGQKLCTCPPLKIMLLAYVAGPMW